MNQRAAREGLESGGRCSDGRRRGRARLGSSGHGHACAVAVDPVSIYLSFVEKFGLDVAMELTC